MLTLTALVCVVLADPIFLDNGKIRVEVEPLLFAVRFVGFSGGSNFVEPIYVDDEQLNGGGWVDPGGIHVELSSSSDEPEIIRGPAKIIEQRDDYIVMIGPVSKTHKVRLKKEIYLKQDSAEALYSVAVIAMSPEPLQVAVRNSVRVPHNHSVLVKNENTKINIINGNSEADNAVVESMEFWNIHIPPKVKMNNVLLGAYVPEIIHENHIGKRWTRRIESMPSAKASVPYGSTFLCRIDSKTQRYKSVLQSAEFKVTQSSPAVFTEIWTIE